MTTYTFGTATLQVRADEQSACLTLPRAWDGKYERDYAAALLFLARSGMPNDVDSECLARGDTDAIIFAWESNDEGTWPAERLEALRRDADGSPVPSDLRDAIDFRLTDVPTEALA